MYLHRLLYRSDAALPGSGEAVLRQVHAIVEASRLANASADITGALLFSSGVFIQALEGPLVALEATFDRICSDLRHRRVRLLELVVADERLFAEWSMVKITPTRELARLAPGLEVANNGRLDATTANAAVQLMRTLLLTSKSSFDLTPTASPLQAPKSTPGHTP